MQGPDQARQGGGENQARALLHTQTAQRNEAQQREHQQGVEGVDEDVGGDEGARVALTAPPVDGETEVGQHALTQQTIGRRLHEPIPGERVELYRLVLGDVGVIVEMEAAREAVGEASQGREQNQPQGQPPEAAIESGGDSQGYSSR